jgi:hypothetical protein
MPSPSQNNMLLADLGSKGWALASTLAVVFVLAAIAVIALRLSRAKRVKVGLTSIELESDGQAAQAPEGSSRAGIDNSVRVDVRRNRFKGDVGDISGVKVTGGDAPQTDETG